MDYVSPGDAFSSSLEQALLLRQKQAEQTKQDVLAQQREDRMNRIQDEERQQATEALVEKRAEFADAQKDKRKASFEKSVSTMVPGDIPDPDMLAQAKTFGMGHLFPEAQPTVPESLPGVAAVPAGQVQTGIDPTRTGAVVNPEQQQGGLRFIGSPAQRKESADDKAALEFAQTLPAGSPERQALEFFVKTGKTPPAGMFKAPGKSRLIFDPVTRKYSDAAGNVVTDVPDGAVVDRAAEPRDTSTAGASRDAEALRKAYDSAVTEMNTRAKPIEGHVSAINDLGMALNERTPQADALIAPLVLKATVSGTGTGFRMTQSEINQVVGARSKWESLSAALNKWATDPTQALSITDEQRTELRQLAKAVRAKAQKQMDNIIKTRHELDDATDPKAIKQLRTRLQDDLSKAETDGASDTPAAPKVIRYDINGKVIP